MQRTRVLFVLPQLDAGGSERVVFELARGLDPGKFEVFVAAFKGGVLVDPLKRICKEVYIVEKKPGFDLSAMMKLADIVRKRGIDVVNAHHYMPCFYSFLGTKVLNGKKLIYTEHSVPEVDNLIHCIHAKIFALMLFRIDGVVGVSKAIADRFRSRFGWHRHKIHQIVNGVDLEKFRPRGAREALRDKWGLRDDHFVVGTVANFRRVKNHLCLVRAAGHLKDTHPQLRLFFVGTGFSGDAENSEGAVLEKIRELGLQEQVILAGYQENIPELLSVFDVFCLPSFSEGLPVSMLEAMAAGLPVIGSEVAGIVEVVQDEKTGFLFAVNDDSKLSVLLGKISDNPGFAKQVSDNALEYVKRFHGLQGWYGEYARVFNEHRN